MDGKALPILALIPYPVLGTLLAFVGIQHGWLARDVRTVAEAAVVLVIAVIGFVTRNLAIGFGAGIVMQQGFRLFRFVQERSGEVALRA